jgi:polysaccharide export outer membrane protein
MLARLLSLLSILWVLVLPLMLPGCGRNYPPPPKLPDPVVNQQVGPGDVLEVVVVGEEKLPKEFEISADGTLEFPYTAPMKVGGTPLADTNHVQVIRLVSDSKSVNAIVSVDAITDNARPDIKLQVGDTIKVDQRLF